ncbi:hypothetical protein DN592_20025 [Raoultella ornithinolytica]|nr:hypothetical protein DN592_20025 [Raoultella ornithinolytica]RWU00636.1 hypothetical protein DN602_09130 [Raoultella ornithinolytica]
MYCCTGSLENEAYAGQAESDVHCRSGARLGSALLTDEEMAEGPGEWRHYSDPFAPWVAA